MANSVIVLAGGLGTRLRSVLPDTPKCLAPVGNQTFLEILTQSLFQKGFDDLVLALGYKSNEIITAVNGFESMPGPIQSVVEPGRLGTGGAMLNAMRRMNLQQAVVVNGDTYFDGDLSGLLAPLDKNQQELCRMAIVAVDDTSRYGGVHMGTQNADTGVVRGFIEKGTAGSGWINAGYYRLHVDCFSTFSAGDTFSFEQDVLPLLIPPRRVRYTKLKGEMIDIGIPADYRRFCTMWNDKGSRS